MKFTLSLLLALLFLSRSTFAGSEITVRRGAAFTIFSSIGGAVLGLSTLPFYEKPQDHTNNINIGALLGLLIGGGYVLHQSSRTESTTDQQKPLQGVMISSQGFFIIQRF